MSATASKKGRRGKRRQEPKAGRKKNGRRPIEVPENVVSLIRKLVVDKKRRDAEIKTEVRQKTGFKISLWKLREVRKGVLKLPKVGGALNGGAKVEREKKEKTVSMVPPSPNGLGGHFRAALKELKNRERLARKQADEFVAQAKKQREAQRKLEALMRSIV